MNAREAVTLHRECSLRRPKVATTVQGVLNASSKPSSTVGGSLSLSSIAVGVYGPHSLRVSPR